MLNFTSTKTSHNIIAMVLRSAICKKAKIPSLLHNTHKTA